MRKLFGMVTTGKSAAYTVAALESFFRCTPMDKGDEFLLIDNDGEWNAADVPEVARERVEIVVNPRGMSVSENANQVIRRADERDADCYFMNNDVIFTPDWLGPVAMDMPGVVTPTCNQNYQYRTNKLELKPVMTMEDYRAGGPQHLAAIAARHREKFHQAIGAYKTNFFVVKIPAAVYRRVGLWETGFGVAGGEDDDYCIRAYLSGFRVLVATASYILHFGGCSTWNGVETRQEWAAREKSFVQKFRAKWGSTITQFLFHKDVKLVANDPTLKNIEKEKGIAALFSEMIRRDGLSGEEIVRRGPGLRPEAS
jgi:GT2 family glycosyltransferase